MKKKSHKMPKIENKDTMNDYSSGPEKIRPKKEGKSKAMKNSKKTY